MGAGEGSRTVRPWSWSWPIVMAMADGHGATGAINDSSVGARAGRYTVEGVLESSWGFIGHVIVMSTMVVDWSIRCLMDRAGKFEV